MARVPSSASLSLAAPIASEEEREHFQRRLGWAALVVFVLGGGFWLVTVVSVAIVAPELFTSMFVSPAAMTQIATFTTALIVWFVVRRTPRSATVLSFLDVFTSVALSWGWSLMVAFGTKGPRFELIALLACTYTLVTRAALVPSRAVRTAAIGLLSLALLIPVTYRLYDVGEKSGPLRPVIYETIWIVVAVGCTSVISAIIYGLRQEVRQAMRLGQYWLEDKIGEGGMGTVYRASHAMLRRPTAIKLLHDGSGAKDRLERFEREVQITARLTHPNTIAVYDYGRTPDGVFYYAMEYLEGISLDGLVATHGRQPVRRVVHVLLQVCGALEEAHAAGLVHRDIKPANIMLTERGGVPDVVKVLDFGLVKEARTGDGTAAALSHVNTILGTPLFMAPESIVDPAGIDGRADLYAVGATAWFLLTGQHLFEGANVVEVCSKHLHEAPTPPSTLRPDVPESLDRIVLACLAKKPEARPRDAAELAHLLRETGLPPWTREDARAWWDAHRPGAAPRGAQPSTDSKVAFGQTIAVALADRERAQPRS